MPATTSSIRSSRDGAGVDRRAPRRLLGQLATRPCRHRRSAAACAGSASPSSPARRRPRPWPRAAGADARRSGAARRSPPRPGRRTHALLNSAWVPTTMRLDPSARPASVSFRALPLSRPVSRPGSSPTGCSSGASVSQVLPGQDLGRGQQRRLAPVLHRRQHGQQGNHGLAAADIALQQPQHPVRRRHVGIDLGQGQALGVGQGEGQGGFRPSSAATRRRWSAGRGAGVERGTAPGPAGWPAARHRPGAGAPGSTGSRSAASSGAWARRSDSASGQPRRCSTGRRPAIPAAPARGRRRRRSPWPMRGGRPAVSG